MRFLLFPPPVGPGVRFLEIVVVPVELTLLWAVILPISPSIVLVSLRDMEALSTRLVIPEKISSSDSGHEGISGRTDEADSCTATVVERVETPSY